ncbi:hypothetical protein C8Q75DRAFT_737142 [Abortiporus biennis]|nr:hypothetical protein C8Q75DRAFT_737142 [Abortiporus biennis]
MALKNTKITFFDLASVYPDRRSLSLWCWTTRLVLNFKGLGYTTQFVEFPDIEPTLKPLGIPPTATKADGSPLFTVPAIIDATDPTKPPVCVSDSQEILLYLEKMYPDPLRPLIPSVTQNTGTYVPAPALYMLVKQFVLSNFMPYILPLVIEDMVPIIPPRAFEFATKAIVAAKGEGHDFITEHFVGKEGSPEKEAYWKKLEAGFGIMALILESGEKIRADSSVSGGAGEFFMGHQVTFADFSLLAPMIMIRFASEKGWGRVSKWHGGRWERYWKALEEYIVVA